MGGGGTARWKSGTQSPRKATCLRIGLEPTGSASGHTVSKTSVPAAPARVADLHDLVGQVPNSAIAAPLAGAAEAPDAPASPNPTATSIARAVFCILLSSDIPNSLHAQASGCIFCPLPSRRIGGAFRSDTVHRVRSACAVNCTCHFGHCRGPNEDGKRSDEPGMDDREKPVQDCSAIDVRFVMQNDIQQ